MEATARYCVYYDAKTEKIVDFFPSNIEPDLKSTVISVWEQHIPRKILKALSEGGLTMQELRKQIGHSNSTLHENVLKLEEAGIVHTKIVYEGNKIRKLEPALLFVTKNPKFRTSIQKFFQGLWVDSDTNQKVVAFLRKHPKDFYTSDEIAAKVGLPVDEVEIALSNWDSQVSRALSDFLKKRPFEKKTLYRGIPE